MTSCSIGSTATWNFTCYASHGWAGQYLRAAELWRANTGDEPFSPVPYFCYCQAIELELKAFLLFKDISAANKKKVSKPPLGHKLTTLWIEARKNGLDEYVSVTSDEERELQIATEWYDRKRFQYPQAIDALYGFRGVPLLSVLTSIAHRFRSEQLGHMYLNAEAP